MAGVKQRILGIDPGSQNTGFGIIEDNAGKLTCIDAGVIRTITTRSKSSQESNLAQRLQIIFQNIALLIEQHRPEVMVVESLFHAKNAQSALILGHARGVALLAAAQHQLTLFEYTPRAIKKGLTGNGAAAKDDVARMVRLLLQDSRSLSLDASDALAVAIYHAHLNPWLRQTMQYTQRST